MNSQPEKILLIRFSALGDVIQTLPILPMVRQSYPDAVIGWAIDSELVPAIKGHPDLNYIHACNRKQWTRAASDVRQWASVGKDMGAFVDEIKQVKYDVVIDLQGLFKTALLSYLTGVKRRIGFAHQREMSDLFYTEKYVSHKEYFDHSVLHVEHMKTLVKVIGCKDAGVSVSAPPTPEATKQKIASIFKQSFSTNEPVIAIAPGTQWESKKWPITYWVQLVEKILTQTKFNIVMLGSRQDAALISRILKGFSTEQLSGRLVDVSGKTTIPEIYAVYRSVQLAIGSDSAPLHIAGAVRTPHVIGLYGATGYRRTPPLGSADVRILSIEGELDCQPCHKSICRLGTTECMQRISPDEVFGNVVGALN